MRAGIERFWILRSPLFLVSLLVLLVNDLYLKGAYPNWLTGKLSDFSGLLVFALFLFPLLAVDPKKVAVGVGLLFVWWKSPWSSFAIDFANVSGIGIGRVADWSDLIALVVLPLSARLYKNRRTYLLRAGTRQRLVLLPIAIVAVFAITGTSRVSLLRTAELRAADGARSISELDVDAVVDSILTSRRDECRPRTEARRACVIDNVWFIYRVQESGVAFEFEHGPGERSAARVNRVIDSIKTAFTNRPEQFTYVEPLVTHTE